MIWSISHRADDPARQIADRHYNRQSIGTPQFVPPGRCFVLLAPGALWVTSWPFAQYVRHAWAGAWVNSCFRRESGPRAKQMIRDALAATLWYWDTPPIVRCVACDEMISMVTFIDTTQVRHKPEWAWGICYQKAGFELCKTRTKGGLAVLHIGRDRLPHPEAPHGTQMSLSAVYVAEREQPGLFGDEA